VRRFKVVEIHLDGKTAFIHLSGKIAENEAFPEVPRDVESVEIDSKNLNSLNSMGIIAMRTWVKEQLAANRDLQVTFSNLAPCLIYTLTLAPELVPPDSKITSLQVPYYNENQDIQRLITYEYGTHFDESEINPPIHITDPEFPGDKLDYDINVNLIESCMKVFYPKIKFSY
jgi:hypothetical protein